MPVIHIEYDIDHFNPVIGVRAVDELIKHSAGNSGTTRSRRYLALGGEDPWKSDRPAHRRTLPLFCQDPAGAFDIKKPSINRPDEPESESTLYQASPTYSEGRSTFWFGIMASPKGRRQIHRSMPLLFSACARGRPFSPPPWGQAATMAETYQ
jgi:hypothetical protein